MRSQHATLLMALIGLTSSATLTLTAIASPADATDTCDGQTPTIVASSGVVTGTPGDDIVVVSGAVTSVRTGAGDDMVCVQSANGAVEVDTGDGADHVEASVPLRLDTGHAQTSSSSAPAASWAPPAADSISAKDTTR